MGRGKGRKGRGLRGMAGVITVMLFLGGRDGGMMLFWGGKEGRGEGERKVN